MSSQNHNVLLLYSNPSDTLRLRLDKEHRAIEQILHGLSVDPGRVVRLHATSVTDFFAELQRSDFEIIQFSGHGSPQGIYLESSQSGVSEEVSAKRIAAILKGASPSLKAVVLISCFSASSIPDLIDAAPYLITVSGPANDESAIEFTKTFYESYFRQGSIEMAFETAIRFVGSILEEEGLYPVLLRRSKERGEGRLLIQAYPLIGDSILIDLTDAEQDLQKLKVTKEEFLFLLTRKIRAHEWIFSIPREKVTLPIGPYFGIFSWKNANDVVMCERILQLKEEVDEESCKVWASIVLSYNDLFSSKYRSVYNPSDPTNAHLLKTAIRNIKMVYEGYFEKEARSKILYKHLGRNYRTSSALIAANIQLAEDKFNQMDYIATVLYLESALSSIHDLVNMLTDNLCE